MADSAVDKLFQLPFEEFTRARNELAAAVKKAGDAAAANDIKALSKPSISAWTVNQLYWKDRKHYDALMKAGEKLRDVQQAVLEGRKGDLRKASEARQDAVVAALDRALDLARAAGHPESPALRQKLTKTLEALAAYGGAAPNTTPGRLVEDIDPPGFGALAGFKADETKLTAFAEASAVKNLRPTTEETKSSVKRHPERGSEVGRPGAPRSDRARRGAAGRATDSDIAGPARMSGILADHREARELARARAERAEAEREAKRLRGAAERAAAARKEAVEREKTAKEDVEEAERTLERARERAKKAARELRERENEAESAERAADEADAAVRAARVGVEE